MGNFEIQENQHKRVVTSKKLPPTDAIQLALYFSRFL